MKINIDYGRKLPLTPDTLGNRELTLDYVNYAVNATYPQGLEGQMRRVWSRIQRKIDEAIEDGDDDIDLEQAEIDFVKKAFKEVKFPANVAKYVVVLEDEVDELGKEKESKKKLPRDEVSPVGR